MLLANTPSATASQLLDLYQSLLRLDWVGPQDLRELGIEAEQLNDLEMRIPLHWVLHLWQRAASRGAGCMNAWTASLRSMRAQLGDRAAAWHRRK